jgi:hypothetical protein
MQKGQRVRVLHPSFPGRSFEGVILRKQGAGFLVRYESFGIMAREVFWPERLEVIEC